MISIHALHEESDTGIGVDPYGYGEFQSTLSMRRATQSDEVGTMSAIFQSTLSMRRATPV